MALLGARAGAAGPAYGGAPVSTKDGRDLASTVAPGAMTALLQELARSGRPVGEAPAFQAGSTVGRFELVRELGHGGFGIVFEARDAELGRQVAFKAVLGGPHAGLRGERLLCEAEAAARLAHPNIVTLYDVGHDARGPYLVYELLRGSSLAARLERGPLPLREALRIVGEAAKGVAHAHQHAVIHRDLTPSNLFLCEDGQVKVLDFGMAQVFGRRAVAGGTRAFMAPEQLRGAPEDERTDVFALGVILYLALSGELPFPDEPALEDARPAPALEVPGLSAVASLVARMLAKDPVARPRDGAAVALSIAAFVRELPDAGPAAPIPAPRRARRPSRAIPLAAIALVVVAGLVAGGGWLGRRLLREAAPAHAAAGPAASVAVLPFLDLSPQRDQEYFSDGLAEEILNALAQVKGLRVVGRTSSFSFRGKNEDLRSVGQKLGVGAVLEGSVRKAGNRVRITAQLVKVDDGYHVWSQVYDRELTDVFVVQDDIARSVVQGLRIELLAGEGAAAGAYRTARPEVHEAYLLARQLVERGSEQGNRAALAELEKAIALDAGYAPAWVELSYVLWGLSDIGEEDAATLRALRARARAAAYRAVELAPEWADAWIARAGVRGKLWDWSGAEEDLDRALRLGARGTGALTVRIGVTAARGDVQAAIAHAEEMVRGDPLSTAAWNWLGWLRYCSGDLERAERELRRSLEISPDHEWPLRNLAHVQIASGDHAGALATAQRMSEEAMRLRMTAVAHHAMGHEAESRKARETLVTRYGASKPVVVAAAYALTGDLERALDGLELGFAQHDPGMRYVKYHPVFRQLRGHRRFTALLRKMNLPPD